MAPTKVVLTYLNDSEQHQILRVNDSRCHVDRIINPKETIVFEAFSDAILEIYSSEYITALLMSKTLIANLYLS